MDWKLILIVSGAGFVILYFIKCFLNHFIFSKTTGKVDTLDTGEWDRLWGFSALFSWVLWDNAFTYYWRVRAGDSRSVMQYKRAVNVISLVMLIGIVLFVIALKMVKND